MGMALAAVADDGDLLALDQVDVGVAIVIDAHGPQVPRFQGGRCPRLHCVCVAGFRARRNIYFSAAACSDQSCAGKPARRGKLRRLAAIEAGPARPPARRSGEFAGSPCADSARRRISGRRGDRWTACRPSPLPTRSSFWREAGPSAGSPETRPSTRPAARASSSPTRRAARGDLNEWELTPEGALARRAPPRPVPAQHVPRHARVYADRSGGPDGRRPGHRDAATTGGRAGAAPLLLPALHALRGARAPGALGRPERSPRRPGFDEMGAPPPRHHRPLRPLPAPQRHPGPREHAGGGSRFVDFGGERRLHRGASQIVRSHRGWSRFWTASASEPRVEAGRLESPSSASPPIDDRA